MKGGDGKSWIKLVEFVRGSSMDLFNLWKDDLLNAMKQNLEAQLQMNTIANALTSTSVRFNFVSDNFNHVIDFQS